MAETPQSSWQKRHSFAVATSVCAGDASNTGANLRRRRSLGCVQLDPSNFETSLSSFVENRGRRKSEGDIGLQEYSKARRKSEGDTGLQCVGLGDASRSTPLPRSSTELSASGTRLSAEDVTKPGRLERSSDLAIPKIVVSDKLDVSTEPSGSPNSARRSSKLGPNSARRNSQEPRPNSARRNSQEPSSASSPSSARRNSKLAPGNAPKMERPSSARSARSSLPANAKLFQSSPTSSSRRLSADVSSSPRRRSSAAGRRVSDLFSEVIRPNRGRRRRSDTDMNSQEKLEDTVFSSSKSLMDRWTRRTIFQKARGVYAHGKVTKAVETPLDMLCLAAKATHTGVHHTLLEHHVVQIWQSKIKKEDAVRQGDASQKWLEASVFKKNSVDASKQNSDASKQNSVDEPVEVPREVLLEDFKGLASKLGELKKVVNVELLPESICSALNAIDVKLDKFDILNDLMHMHNCTYSDLSSKFDAQLSQIANIISVLTKDFRSFQQCVQDEMANPTTSSAGLKTFLPAVEHCLVALGIISVDLGEPKKVAEDYEDENGTSIAHSPDPNRVPRSQCRRWSLGGAPIVRMRQDGQIEEESEEESPTETKMVSEHDAPVIIVYDSEKTQDDKSSLGGFSDESDAESQEFEEPAQQADSLEMSADPPLQADSAPQAARSESESPASLDELPVMSSTPQPQRQRRPSHSHHFLLPGLDQPLDGKLLERSKKKQKTWQSGGEVSQDQSCKGVWQAIAAKMKQDRGQDAKLGKLFGDVLSPCTPKVAKITGTASAEVCKAHQALGEAYGLSQDELNKICLLMKCDDILDIGNAARRMAKELGGEHEVLQMIRRELGEETWSKVVSWWKEEKRTSAEDFGNKDQWYLAQSKARGGEESGRHSAASSSAAPSPIPGFSSHHSLPEVKDRIQVAKPSQPRSAFHRYRYSVKKRPEKYSTDTLSVLQTKLLTKILDEDMPGDCQSGDLLQIVCNASASEYMPQAPEPEPPLKVKLPWDDNTDVTCQSRPRTCGSIGFERLEGRPAPLPSIGGAAQGMIGGPFVSRPGTTPAHFRSQSWRNQLMSKTRPTPGSHQSLIWRRDQLNPHSLPVLVGRCKREYHSEG